MVSNPCSGSELTLIVSRTPLPPRGRKLRNVSKYVCCVLFLSHLPHNSLVTSDARSWPMHISSCQIQNGGGSTIPCTDPRRSARKTLLRPRTSLRTLRICLVEREPRLLLRTLSGRTLIMYLRMFSKRLVDPLFVTGVLGTQVLTITFSPLLAIQLLQPEVHSRAPWWAYLGAACGAGLGFIVANVPGLMVGAYAGNRLGAVRDAKGKAVAAVFAELGNEQKAEVWTS